MGLYFNTNLDKKIISTGGGGFEQNRILLQKIVPFAIKNCRYNGKKKRPDLFLKNSTHKKKLKYAPIPLELLKRIFVIKMTFSLFKAATRKFSHTTRKHNVLCCIHNANSVSHSNVGIGAHIT